MKLYVVKTNPRCEERAAASTERAGFVPFLPMMKREFRHAKSKRWISRRYPLFVGYLFVGIPVAERDSFGKVRKCDGVKEFVGKCGAVGAEHVIDVPHSDVAAVMEAAASGTFDQLRPLAERMKKGQRVAIDLGALAGRHAEVDAIGKTRATVLLEMFGSRMAVELPIDCLRPAA